MHLCLDAWVVIEVSNQSFNEIFEEYEAMTRRKVEVTYVPVSEYDERLASNPNDVASFLHRLWATTDERSETDNHLYPDWNPSSVIDNIPVA